METGHSLALHYVHYNFARAHEALGCTPAMAAGVAGPVSRVREIAELLERPEAPGLAAA